MKKLLIRNAEVTDAPAGVPHYIYIEDNKIVFVKKTLPENFDFADVEVLEGGGKLATPGLVNTHGHVAMTLLRSYADDLDLMDWLQNKIWPVEAKMKPQDIYWGSMLGIYEMLRGGTTCFADMYAEMDEVAQAAAKLGIRANLSRGLIGAAPNAQEALAENKQLFKDWHNYDRGQIRVTLGPHAPYTCPDDFLRQVVDASFELGAEVQMHLCETKGEIEDSLRDFGMTPIARMEKIGLLERGVIAAHCVHLTEEDMDIMAARQMRVALNPQSNLKLASGIAPVPALLKEGICVGIGTDGASSNNNLDMLEEVRLTAMLHKATTYDPLALPAAAVWKMATEDGAKVLGFKNLGRLEAGAYADIVLWKMSGPHWYPRHNKLSLLVYAASSQDAETVLVNGKVVLKDGHLTAYDEEKICAETAACAKALLER